MIARLAEEGLRVLLDVAPIAAVIVAFQAGIVRQRPAHLGTILVGSLHVLVGLTLFRVGLAESLLPIGSLMAEQLARPAAPGAGGGFGYVWLYGFAAAIGLAATLIEPTLTAVANRVYEMTGGALRPWSLRLVVASGVAMGLALGTVRIAVGFPLEYLLVPMVTAIAVLSFTAPRRIIPLAYDSGALATSVVTVPMIAAFGGERGADAIQAAPGAGRRP